MNEDIEKLKSVKNELEFIKEFGKVVESAMRRAELLFSGPAKDLKFLISSSVTKYVKQIILELYTPFVKEEDIKINLIGTKQGAKFVFGDLYSFLLMCGNEVEGLKEDPPVQYESDLCLFRLSPEGYGTLNRKYGKDYFNL